MLRTNQIQIRDPFIVPHAADQRYYLFGTTDRNAWSGQATGFDCYHSPDLQTWQGPLPAFRPPAGFWSAENFWAPEVHHYQGRYYMFASFKAPQRYRATQILVSDQIEGPYVPLSEGPITPAEWECLDGTLYVADDGKPWIVFCHEWVQIHNGAMIAMPLSDDLKSAAGRPVYLFSASEAPWVKRSGWPRKGAVHQFPTYITDGPFLYRTRNGRLLMLWSSMGDKGYAMGIAYSETDTITGPWRQDPDPLWAEDGGHGMLFQAFDGHLWLTFHRPNSTPDERPVFLEVEDTGDSIRLVMNETNRNP